MSWVLWITGLPGSGKTTLAQGLVEALAARGIRALLIDYPTLHRALIPEPHDSPLEQEVAHRAIVHMAKTLRARRARGAPARELMDAGAARGRGTLAR